MLTSSPAIFFFQQTRPWGAGIGKRAGAFKHIGKGAAVGVDLEMSFFTPAGTNIQILRIGGDPVDRPRLAPEVPTMTFTSVPSSSVTRGMSLP